MKKQQAESVKLGSFVLTGLLLLIITLYIIGKNKGLFSDSFELKTHFRAVNGLVTGNNVRFAGIDVGVVKSVVFLNDTVIEVSMDIETKMRNIIRSNALTHLGTDGLIGNRVLNIMPARGAAAPTAKDGDLLPSKEEISTDAMLETLHQTNKNIAVISEELRIAVHRIGSSAQLTALLEDPSLMRNLKASLTHLHETTEKSATLMANAIQTLDWATKGDGTLATLLTDTSLIYNIEQAVLKIKTVEDSAEKLAQNINEVVATVDKDFNSGKGTVNALMRDSTMTTNLRNTLINVEKGTAAFNENMEALKHNFLFRKYFKKLERQKKKS